MLSLPYTECAISSGTGCFIATVTASTGAPHPSQVIGCPLGVVATDIAHSSDELGNRYPGWLLVRRGSQALVAAADPDVAHHPELGLGAVA